MNKKQESISIIVPIYNGEKYIDDFCNQLNAQTFKNFEILFIEDCSKDNSYNKLLENSKKYSFMQVFQNEENKGAGFSRNFGIQKAKYNYIGFLDCDDFIPSNYFEELTKTLWEYNADMVLCDVKITYEKGYENLPDSYVSACHQIPVSKKDILHNDFVAGSWNKIIKKEILEQNLFVEGMISEDIPAIIGSILDSKTIAYTNKTFYTYVQRKHSVQNGSEILKKFDVFKAIEELVSRKKEQKELVENLDAIVYHQLILFLIYGIIGKKELKRKSKYLKIFEKKAKKYNFRNNPYFKEFLASQNSILKLYYQLILFLMKLRLFCFAGFLISFANNGNDVRKKMKKKVTKKNITLEDIRKVAIKNQKQNSDVSISVIIPNYNYQEYLLQRVYSILNQKQAIKEIIFLDDCSTDSSIELINNIVKTLQDSITCKLKYNTKNSGSPFKQWALGFSMVESDYVWIAEADDYANPNFLKEVLKPMKQDNSMLISYCDSSYINKEGCIIKKTVKDLVDIMNSGHWDNNYINDGKNEIENYAFLNCTIANVSSVVFKNGDYSKDLDKASTFKQCGDWYFYYSIMRKGKVAYSRKRYNYCRIHNANSTTNLKKKIHYEEIKQVQKEIQENYSIRKEGQEYIEKRLEFLRNEWDLTED